MFKIGIKNEIVLGNSIRSYGCSVKSKHANKLKYQTQALMGAMRLAGHFSAVSSRVIGKKLHLLLSIVCIFPFNYPDARRVAPISACVFCSAFQATYNATKTVALLMQFLNTLPVRAKALLQCALDFYRTATTWFIGYGA